jgi:hypothetical protein
MGLDGKTGINKKPGNNRKTGPKLFIMCRKQDWVGIFSRWTGREMGNDFFTKRPTTSAYLCLEG